MEPFPCRVRTDPLIVGLSALLEEVRLSFYADDATAIVCTEYSVSQLFLLTDIYGQASGARLNKDVHQMLFKRVKESYSVH